jgi:outer membrane protein
MRWIIALVAAATMNIAVAADSNIAVVDMERALFLSDAAKEAVGEFEKANKSDIDKLKSLQNERRALKNEVEQKTQEYQFYGRKLQQLEEKWKQVLFQKQSPELEKILNEIIKKEGYDVVLNAQVVIYKSPAVDITKLLLERLNEKK